MTPTPIPPRAQATAPPPAPGAAPPPGPTPDQSRANRPPRAPTRLQRFAAWCVHVCVSALAATIRFRSDPHSSPELAAGTPPRLVLAAWHNRLALCMPVYQRYFGRHGHGRHMTALVSPSRDGGFLTAVLERSGAYAVRGSSSRRGAQALRELVTAAQERNCDLAITPDGPRGPCYHVQDGVISVAQWSGLAIVTVSLHLRWKLRLRTWDRFQIPLPFTRCDVHLGTPLHVPADADSATRERLRQQLEHDMRAVTRD